MKNKSLIKISETQAILLSYYQGLAKCGEWIMPVPAYVKQDTGMSPSLARQTAIHLARNGLIEENKVARCRSHEYRVVKRLESPEVVITCGRRNSVSIELMREKALAREARRRGSKTKRKLISYAGAE